MHHLKQLVNTPAIRCSAKVLVTGSNGYVGTWIVRTLIDRRFSVRAVVRAESKTTYFRKLFKSEVDYGFSGPRLKRVIYTSSDVAHFSPRPKGFYNESNFNDERTVEAAAWSFVSDHKPDITWDLSVVRPIYVFGPVLQEANSPADLSISSAMVYDALVANDKRPTLQNFSPINCDWVDVRDAALDHVHNIEVPVAGKDMFILSSGPFIWQDLLDVANELKIPGTNALVRNPGFSKTYPFDMV